MISYNINNKLIFLIKILLIFSFFLKKSIALEKKEIKSITEGNKNASIEILIFESLTCPACAAFHNKVYPDLKKNFIDKGLVKINNFRSIEVLFY